MGTLPLLPLILLALSLSRLSNGLASTTDSTLVSESDADMLAENLRDGLISSLFADDSVRREGASDLIEFLSDSTVCVEVLSDRTITLEKMVYISTAIILTLNSAGLWDANAYSLRQ
jgi:hypothetical protein